MADELGNGVTDSLITSKGAVNGDTCAKGQSFKSLVHTTYSEVDFAHRVLFEGKFCVKEARGYL